jgi:hypothetical protein
VLYSRAHLLLLLLGWWRHVALLLLLLRGVWCLEGGLQGTQ